MMKRRTLIAATSGLLALPAVARAQGWKAQRPVTMQVPFSAGGPTDVMARLLAQKMSAILGQPVPVENVGGAGGILGTQRTSRAEPDGYTIGLGHMGTHSANPSFYKSLPYDPVASFRPLSLFAVNPMVLAAKPSFVRSLPELRQWIGANRGQLTVATAGTGSVSFLGALLFDRATEAGATLVPYRGAGPALQDTMNGVTDVIVDQAVTVIPQARGGTLVPLAVTVPQRLPQLPDVPTAAEAGLPALDIAVWNAAFAPAGLPDAQAQVLTAAISQALDDQALAARFAEMAIQVTPPDQRGPDALRALIAREIPRWAKLTQEAGIKPE
ncbi:Bug family tripartite tricarboxylate transporter substrate binding protein [Teichococcus oryzae]|uniref:Tripartite tricarboxylate transporter substrate binding protein BugD n=1 Tax=Teichococcus oryzae TaxID=1608942 RepID=A0A5B2TEQ8_9PROT|nr:tripartite tricarboxylate transporter substrate-binding protein [Pseudoroseomonas oryzae]KAA2212368.1 tripartite tricarboxylate transporter substrate binding protein BugD [Pseudoroseomonas oryzae]